MTPASPVTLLRRALERSGYTSGRFAREVLIRDERTVRRWLSGESPIPAPVVAFLGVYVRTGGSDAAR